MAGSIGGRLARFTHWSVSKGWQKRSVVIIVIETPFTAFLKPKVASKNPWMGEYMQKKGFGKGFDLVNVATI